MISSISADLLVKLHFSAAGWTLRNHACCNKDYGRIKYCNSSSRSFDLQKKPPMPEIISVKSSSSTAVCTRSNCIRFSSVLMEAKVDQSWRDDWQVTSCCRNWFARSDPITELACLMGSTKDVWEMKTLCKCSWYLLFFMSGSRSGFS